ncbi:hypothetical protein Dimus_007180, partial [Dionaea muscipula]
MEVQSKTTQELLKYFEFHHLQDQKLKVDICLSLAKFTKQMGSVVKDVDTLAYAIQESIPKKISANTDDIEKMIEEATEDNRNHLELMGKKMKMIGLDLSIDFSKKL